ncbi:hypothetical protein [Thermococcus sp.]|uniref:hypothetical protein n=1 Tax=Thermococcus sp. TaxID=35749 RepID=UPI00262CCE52|nr:hypothetical protein [Thermococcus sp.]
MNWGKTTFGVFLVAMVLSLQLVAAPQAMAMTANNTSITFRRAVVAWYDDKGRLQMNVTWVNKVLNFTNLTKGCPLHKFNVTPKVNVSIVTLYNMSEKHEQLLFFRLNFYNSTFNYTMYALVYRAERSQYNFTLATKIFTDLNRNYKVYLTMMNIAPANDRRSLPVGDMILTANNLTLSQYYWTLNRVLMNLRRHDETAWIWGRSAFELRHLSHLVRLKLPEYNQGKAIGLTIPMDDKCTSSCGLICSLSTTPFCFLLCGIVADNPLCDITCSVMWGAACGFGCSAVCAGTTDLCSIGCGGVCAGICSAACTKMGPFSFFCEEYACAPACTGACEVVCG